MSCDCEVYTIVLKNDWVMGGVPMIEGDGNFYHSWIDVYGPDGSPMPLHHWSFNPVGGNDADNETTFNANNPGVFENDDPNRRHDGYIVYTLTKEEYEKTIGSVLQYVSIPARYMVLPLREEQYADEDYLQKFLKYYNERYGTNMSTVEEAKAFFGDSKNCLTAAIDILDLFGIDHSIKGVFNPASKEIKDATTHG